MLRPPEKPTTFKIWVQPGPIPGSPLALTNHLNQLRCDRPQVALIIHPAAPADEPPETTRCAAEWARINRVAIQSYGRPDIAIVAIDLGGADEFPTMDRSEQVYAAANAPAKAAAAGNWFQQIRHLLQGEFHRMTVLYVNTTNENYLRPGHPPVGR